MKSPGGERTGAAIRKLRLAKGLTLAELSQLSGIPLSTLSRVELGQNGLNSEKLVRLCRALDVDLQGLVTKEAASTVRTSGRRAVMRVGDGLPV
jgi:transcriptional regulator with XRE-family HTH domain